MRLAASVLDAVQGAVAAEAETRGPADQVARLADSLALQLLGELGQARPLGVTRSGGLGTHSLPALRAFLRGEQHFRRANWDSAQVSYDRAVELDSAFALAYWRLGMARRWETRMDDSLGLSYLLRAAGLNKGLPPRESLLISCDSLLAFLSDGMLVDSATDRHIERLFRTARLLTQHYPTDPESWAALGEAGAHFGAGRGMGEESQLEAFARAIVLDSTFAPAYFHAIELAAFVDDWTMVRQYAVSLLALRPGWDDGASFARTVVRILDRRPSSAELDRLIDTVPVQPLVNIVNTFVSAADSEEIGIEVGRRFSQRRSLFDEETREGLFAGTLAYRGHLREASQLLGRHPGLMVAGTFTELAMFGLIPPDSADAVFERQIVEGPDTREADRSPPLRLGFPLPWWAARRDTTAIKRYGARLSRAGAGSQVPMLDLYLHAASSAYLALARGDTAEAAAQLQALPATSGWVWYERLTLAQALRALGREREALAVLDREFPSSLAIFHRGIWALERARLAERLGDRDKARHWYGYVARLWRHADPELQPIVNETREALERLTAENQR